MVVHLKSLLTGAQLLMHRMMWISGISKAARDFREFATKEEQGDIIDDERAGNPSIKGRRMSGCENEKTSKLNSKLVHQVKNIFYRYRSIENIHIQVWPASTSSDLVLTKFAFHYGPVIFLLVKKNWV
jgi:hypothetical protein